MSDSKWSVPLDSSPGLGACVETVLKGVPVRCKSHMRGLSSLQSCSYRRSYDNGQFAERTVKLPYSDILIRGNGVLLLIEKFSKEVLGRGEKKERGTGHTRLLKNIPVAKYSYWKTRVKQCQLKFERHQFKLISGNTVIEVMYSSVVGLAVGCNTSTFARHLVARGKEVSEEYCFSVYTRNRTYDCSVAELELFRSTYLNLLSYIKEHSDLPIIGLGKGQLVFQVVKTKLQEEAKKRTLTISQLFLLGFIYICRVSYRVKEEFILIRILSRTFSGTSRFYRMINYAKDARKYSVKPLSSAQKRKERERIASIRTKRYLKLKTLLEGQTLDTSLTTLLKTQEQLIPNFKRLFRKNSVRGTKQQPNSLNRTTAVGLTTRP